MEHMLELHKRSPQLPPRENTPALAPGASVGTGRRKSPCNGPLEEHQGFKIEPAADGRIDRLVYELYGLSPEEINIVEGNR